jgi:hypothetical protein
MVIPADTGSVAVALVVGAWVVVVKRKPHFKLVDGMAFDGQACAADHDRPPSGQTPGAAGS